jgi:hypothetical protein
MRRWLLLVLLAACGTDQLPAPEQPLFPADYAYADVRTCRMSLDHNFKMVHVFADEISQDAYMLRDRPFPTGSTILKEEHAGSDSDCTGPILSWTVMMKLDDGTSSRTLDWKWQRVDANREVITEDENQCASCHATCDPPDGYLGTCAAP